MKTKTPAAIEPPIVETSTTGEVTVHGHTDGTGTVEVRGKLAKRIRRQAERDGIDPSESLLRALTARVEASSGGAK